jgi:nucleoside 2-deoxyribosyltransferase
MSWDGDLSDAERAEWDSFVHHVRENTVKAMEESAFVASLVPTGETDVKFAVELGLAIMLGKPIIALVIPGTEVPAGLVKVADAIICADLDTEDGQRRAAAEMKTAMARIGSRS